MRLILFLATLFFFVDEVKSTNIVDVQIDVAGYKKDTIIFGAYFGGERKEIHPVIRSNDGKFHITSGKLFPEGMYYVQFLPNGDYFEFILDSDQQFVITTTYPNILDKIKCVGSAENELFFQCVSIINVNRSDADKKIKMIGLLQFRDPERAKELQRELDMLNETVVQQQLYFTQQYPNSISHKYVVASSLPVPDEYNFQDTIERKKADQYVRTHYFDNIDFNDGQLLRSPYPYNMIQGYLNMNLDSPDQLIAAVDHIMKFIIRANDNKKVYFAFLARLLSSDRPKILEYAHVHLLLSYVQAGKTPWISKADSTQLVSLATQKEKLLVGKPSPDLVLETKDGTKKSILANDARLTVLYFGDYNCELCQEGFSGLLEFSDYFKDKNVKVVGICTNGGDEYKKCFKYAEAFNVSFDFLADPVNGRKAKEIFNLPDNPVLFLLDKDKTILAKRLALPELYKLVSKELEKDKSKE